MHPHIAEMPSSLFYDGQLISAPSALALTPAPFPWPAPDTPVAFLPVDQARETAEGLSQANAAEAGAVCAAVAAFLARGAAPADIGVITFYAAQARLLRRRLPSGVECNTVDAFQGREKDVVVLS
jgi:superfamily I DNA and/or RNA helicase